MTDEEAKREHQKHLKMIRYLVSAGFLPEEQKVEGEILLAEDAVHERIMRLGQVVKMHGSGDGLLKLKKEVLLYLNLVAGGIDTFIQQHPEYNRED